MQERPFWQQTIERAWSERPVVWLRGVRRVGKTTLAQSLDRIRYFDCELPGTRRRLENPESFLRHNRGARLVLDEIHRLPNPSEVLKIAADHFPGTRVLATGSSTLGASARFRDTLAGRKVDVFLPPMIQADIDAFGRPGLEHRMRRGGLPPFFLASTLPERDFQEWVDAYWAKDILELFRLEKRAAFQRLFELVLARSGGLFDASRFARECGVSRTTVANYLAVLEATSVAHVVRPYSEGGTAEIVAAPRVFGFDTGFVCYHRGWEHLRPDDVGGLIEHLFLNEIHAHGPEFGVHYWRDKAQREVDFVLLRRGGAPIAVECKRSLQAFDAAHLASFRRRYPRGANWLVVAEGDETWTTTIRDLDILVVPLARVAQALALASRTGGSGTTVAG
ncbi:MAG: ATP-binding protein [Vicinamibacteria bacterium]|nr:ATP-binding protein [Vicinamibacteria bacterium]